MDTNGAKERILAKATELLENAVTPDGILASTAEADNYKRIWTRDGIVAGLAGALVDNPNILEGLKRTILTLSRHQHPLGIIPSNVLVTNDGADCSFGSLAGRVDATCWYVVGACLLLKKFPSLEEKDFLKERIDKALLTLHYWEFNNQGLLYIPTSGNWADEYPVKGHTLYDNLLRLWGLRLYKEVFGEGQVTERLAFIEEKIKTNFWPEERNMNSGQVYHPRLFKNMTGKRLKHWLCYLAPEGFDTTFDAAGNGLALLLNIGDEAKTEALCQYLATVFSYLGKCLVPAFWPPIHPGDDAWTAIANNYSFDFKNNPYCFHNGGIWPVWMGLLALGLCRQGKKEIAQKIWDDYLKIESPDNIGFFEYINANEWKPSGKAPLCYTASGLVFMAFAIDDRNKTLTEIFGN